MAALPAALRQDGATPSPTGVLIGITPTDPTVAIELQRAPDDGTGNANAAAAVTVTTLPPSPVSGIKYPDLRFVDGTFQFYRWRHIGAGYDPGTWTGWKRAKATTLPAGSNLQSDTGLYPVRRDLPFVDDKFALRATETDGSTKKSDAHNPQGSILPFISPLSFFSYAAGGPAGGQMWLSFGWSSANLTRPDQTTLNVPAAPAAPGIPTVSQVAGGALAARTRWARVAYAKYENGFAMLYPVGAEASLAISANNLLKVTSPANPGGGFYDGWVPLVGATASNEFVQGNPGTEIIAFGTDWTEPTTGFSSTANSPWNASWKSLTRVGLIASTTYYNYAYFDITNNLVRVPASQGAKSVTLAAAQNGDGTMSLGPYDVTVGYSGVFAITTPNAGLTGSGNFGGGRLQ